MIWPHRGITCHYVIDGKREHGLEFLITTQRFFTFELFLILLLEKKKLADIVMMTFWKIVFLSLLLVTAVSGRKLKFKEEFYRLYYLPHYATQHDYHRNIFWLEIAMYAAFAPPIQALTICKTEKQYQKYQLLLKMHLNYLMAKNHVFIAVRYDKHEPLWFNRTYKEDILKSLDIAEYHYKCAGSYWEKMLDYKRLAEGIKNTRIDLDFLEDMVYKVNQGDVNYQRVTRRQLAKLEKTRAFFNAID